MKQGVLNSKELLEHWQGHRKLTRRVIELFPEKELFSFSIGGMRPFSEMAAELLSIAVPALREIVDNTVGKYEEGKNPLQTKEQILQYWDEATPLIDELFMQISPERFEEEHNLFGEYKFPIIHNVFYFIDNEIHHRAQGYVYLRALGIEPPFFWDR